MAVCLSKSHEYIANVANIITIRIIRRRMFLICQFHVNVIIVLVLVVVAVAVAVAWYNMLRSLLFTPM